MNNFIIKSKSIQNYTSNITYPSNNLYHILFTFYKHLHTLLNEHSLITTLNDIHQSVILHSNIESSAIKLCQAGSTWQSGNCVSVVLSVTSRRSVHACRKPHKFRLDNPKVAFRAMARSPKITGREVEVSGVPAGWTWGEARSASNEASVANEPVLEIHRLRRFCGYYK